LVSHPGLGDFFEEAARHYTDYQNLANWVNGEIQRLIKDHDLILQEMHSSGLVETLKLLDEGTVNRAVAKEILEEALLYQKKPGDIVKSKNLGKITNEQTLYPLVEETLKANPKACESYLQGKEKALGFLMGKVMSMTNGRADPATVRKMVKDMLDQRSC